ERLTPPLGLAVRRISIDMRRRREHELKRPPGAIHRRGDPLGDLLVTAEDLLVLTDDQIGQMNDCIAARDERRERRLVVEDRRRYADGVRALIGADPRPEVKAKEPSRAGDPDGVHTA